MGAAVPSRAPSYSRSERLSRAAAWRTGSWPSPRGPASLVLATLREYAPKEGCPLRRWSYLQMRGAARARAQARASGSLCAADGRPSRGASVSGGDPGVRRSEFQRGRRPRARPSRPTSTGPRPSEATGLHRRRRESARARACRPLRPWPLLQRAEADGKRRQTAARDPNSRPLRDRATSHSRRL